MVSDLAPFSHYFFLDFINRKINYDKKDCCSHETAKLVTVREIRSPLHIVLRVEQDSVRGKPLQHRSGMMTERSCWCYCYPCLDVLQLTVCSHPGGTQSSVGGILKKNFL